MRSSASRRHRRLRLVFSEVGLAVASWTRTQCTKPRRCEPLSPPRPLADSGNLGGDHGIPARSRAVEGDHDHVGEEDVTLVLVLPRCARFVPGDATTHGSGVDGSPGAGVGMAGAVRIPCRLAMRRGPLGPV